MADSEGSVFVEGVDVEVEDESSDTTNENAEVENKSETTDDDNSQKQETETENAPEQKGEVKLTDKGTKLDENPLSAAHQQLANAKRDLERYEAFLKNPDAIARYLEQNGYKKGEATEAKKPEPLMKIDVSKLQTAEDVAEALNNLQTAFLEKLGKSEETTSSLMKQLQGLSEGRRVEQIGSTMTSDVSRIRSEYPELDPKSGEGVYNAELEKDIAELYHSLDFDEKSGGYKGGISLYQISKQVMSAASKAQKRGSEMARTDVKVKNSGKVVTSSNKGSAKTDENADAGLTIASRVSKALNNK